MTKDLPHITICIPTYKRINMLERLLFSIKSLSTNALFTYSALVVDNDIEQSARPLVTAAQNTGEISIDYHVEPEVNIALARNRAIHNAHGDFIAFIDDDEFPSQDWLLNLYLTCERFSADGVLGQVIAHFPESVPPWIIKSNLLERESYPTGHILRWDQTRTGNVLMNRKIFGAKDAVFDPEFTHGEDKDFFRRMINKKRVFIWCDEAPVFETYPPDRLKKIYFLKRALLRGGVSLIHSNFQLSSVLFSMFAFVIYTLSLPLLVFWGQPIFMKYLVKDCDHIGKLLMACKVDLRKYLIHSI